jgi:2,3-bisphosphoglycerate-independent phosphoglycerate mutase
LPQTTLLIVLDGWGHSDDPSANAIAAARTPLWDRLWREAPHTLISGSGVDVGLPSGQMGNSEVGHMNIGAGRIVHQDFTRISHAIETGEFEQNPVLQRAMDIAAESARPVHVMGLLSPGGVHSHEDQIHAMVRLAAKRGSRVYVHAFLDGRDTPPRSAEASISRMGHLLDELGCGCVASIVGRYYAMDRDNRWDRTERAFNLLTRGEAPFHAETAIEALHRAYAREESDEFVQPTAIHRGNDLPIRIDNGDVVIFMNFRADRARQLTHAFVDDDFDAFTRRTHPTLGDFVTLTRYAADITTSCAFEPEQPHNTIGEYLSQLGRRQLRIAETEKYAHVTFFFNGGREAPFEGEERILVPSPKVATYDLQPEMSAPEVTRRLVDAITRQEFDFIVCNFANGDMVGHTGVFPAAVEAVETVDRCLAKILEALDANGGQCLITSDHGNVERMSDAKSGQAHTAHTSEPVPLIYVGPRKVQLRSEGILSDIAPTLLDLMGLDKPDEMTGHSLVCETLKRAASN